MIFSYNNITVVVEAVFPSIEKDYIIYKEALKRVRESFKISFYYY
jgi:hypothetical protein